MAQEPEHEEQWLAADLDELERGASADGPTPVEEMPMTRQNAFVWHDDPREEIERENIRKVPFPQRDLDRVNSDLGSVGPVIVMGGKVMDDAFLQALLIQGAAMRTQLIAQAESNVAVARE